jgi:hypothetical protein
MPRTLHPHTVFVLYQTYATTNQEPLGRILELCRPAVFETQALATTAACRLTVAHLYPATCRDLSWSELLEFLVQRPITTDTGPLHRRVTHYSQQHGGQADQFWQGLWHVIQEYQASSDHPSGDGLWIQAVDLEPRANVSPSTAYSVIVQKYKTRDYIVGSVAFQTRTRAVALLLGTAIDALQLVWRQQGGRARFPRLVPDELGGRPPTAPLPGSILDHYPTARGLRRALVQTLAYYRELLRQDRILATTSYGRWLQGFCHMCDQTTVPDLLKLHDFITTTVHMMTPAATAPTIFRLQLVVLPYPILAE